MRVVGLLLVLHLSILAWTETAFAAEYVAPSYLPRYDVQLTMDVPNHEVHFQQTITWTNPCPRETSRLYFTFYPLYKIPDGDYLLLAKTLEILRLEPSYGIDRTGRHGEIHDIKLQEKNGNVQTLAYEYREDNPCAIMVNLPHVVREGETVTVVINASIHLKEVQGRWGYWRGVTYLTNALPVVTFYDEKGWHDLPFIPWHQPFWNEAGIYNATITLPSNQMLGVSAEIAHEVDLGQGWKRIHCKPFTGRDFALVSSAQFREFRSSCQVPDGRIIQLKCLALPQHEFYAKEMLEDVARAIPIFSEWFGPFPYDEFKIVESYFGWNGNECGGLVLIDERVFDMPHVATGYVEYLVTHETCHQWWYNLVGTNGFAETFMDEGAATYFSHKLIDQTRGKNNQLLRWPLSKAVLPNIKRENYRFGSLYGAIRRDDAPAAAGELPEFGHLINLFSGAYDRGSKVFGMIETRLGPEFEPFIQHLVKKYSFRYLSAQDLKEELIAFTGPATATQWNDFFAQWVYSNALTDWSVESVRQVGAGPRPILSLRRMPEPSAGPVEIILRQRRELNEPTTLGIKLAGSDGFPVRIPIVPSGQPMVLPEYNARVDPLGDGRWRVRLDLPRSPTQVTLDPDNVLLDANPANNRWKPEANARLVPIYNMTTETSLTNDYDRWNFALGPWIWGASYRDPWYTRSSMVGVRAGAFRSDTFAGGAYAAFRSDFRDLVIGVDGLIDHWPYPKAQIGFNYERRIGGPYGNTDGDESAQRAVVYARHVINYSSSLYLYPMQYAEVYATYQDNFLPFSRSNPVGAVRPDDSILGGIHYRLNLYTPYWNPEQGIWVDLNYAGGQTKLERDATTHQFSGQVAGVQTLPEGLGYLSHVRAAGRLSVAAASPDRGEFFALGGGTLFRGFDLAERQGSLYWVSNAELRFPVGQDLRWNFADSLIGVRNIYLAGFYDVGNIYVNGDSVGGTAHALGAGLRVDVAIFSFIERATFRLDVAKTVNAASPFQFWFGFQHPF